MVDPFSIKECVFVCERHLCEEGHLEWGFVYVGFFIWKSIKISLTASSVSSLCSGHVFTMTFPAVCNAFLKDLIENALINGIMEL